MTATGAAGAAHVIVPAGAGRAFDVEAGRRLTLTTPHGGQAADFFAFDAHDLSDWLSPMHTWTWTRRTRPFAGQDFLSLSRRTLLHFVADNAGGAHDMFIAACDQERYRQLGHTGYHRSCAENLRTAMGERGHQVTVIPQPVNFFTSTEVDANQRLIAHPNDVQPGASVELEAHIDLVCVVSSCPYDLRIPDWQINSPAGVSELEVAIA